MTKLLTAEEADEKLKKLSVEWALPNDATLHRVYTFDDYMEAVKFVTKVGSLAERHNHHPELKLSWGKVEVACSTHEVGGLSNKDFKLATAIEKAYRGA